MDDIIKILEKAGNSNKASRNAVIAFFGSSQNLEAAAALWAYSHGVSANEISIAFATAVDLGYRIAQKTTGSY